MDKTKNKNEGTIDEGDIYDKSRNDGTENERTKHEERGNVNMEEKKIDFGQEYGSSIAESLTYRQYLADCAYVLDNFSPVSRVLPFRSSMPDEESKKFIDGFVKSDMPTYLAKVRKISEDCLSVGEEISAIAKTLAQQRKNSIGKQ